MQLIQLWTLLTSLDPKTLLLGITLVLIAVNQGWLHIQGFKIKKAKKAEIPTKCLSGRTGACQLVRLQMEYAETAMDDIKSEAYSHYLKIRKEKLGGKELLSHDRDAHHYKSTLYQVSDSTKDLVRYFFRQNHLSEMSDAEFKIHVAKRTDKIVTRLTDDLSLLYYPNSDPDRIELYDYNLLHVIPSVRLAVEDVFEEGRKLAIQFYKGELDKYMEARNV